MKYYLSLVLTVFIATNTSAQKADCLVSKESVRKNGILTYEQINLYNIKQQLIEKTERFLDENLAKYTKTERFVYDERNNIIETTTLLNGIFEKAIFKKFDLNNQLIEEAIVLKDGTKASLSKSINGNEIKTFNLDGTFTNTIQEKDSAGRITRETIFDVNGNSSSETEFLYSERGDLLKKFFVEIPRKRTTETAFERNENGEILSEIVKINAEPFSRKLFDLNDTGKVMKMAAFNRYDQLDYELSYTYNENGDITSESYFHDKELITKKENTYDENNRLILQNNFERGKLVSAVKWEYICF